MLLFWLLLIIPRLWIESSCVPFPFLSLSSLAVLSLAGWLAMYTYILTGRKIIGAPSFFPTVWSWIKRWFDPGTTSKIFILTPADVKPTLTSFMDISNIPKCYGGELEWQWGDMPNLDDDARAIISGVESASPSTDKVAEGRAESGYLKGPMVFNTEKNRVDVLGKIKGQPRRMEIPVSIEKSEQSDTTASSSSLAPATAETTPGTTPANATPAEEKTEGATAPAATPAPAQESA